MKRGLQIAFDEITIPPDHTYIGMVWYDDDGNKNIVISNNSVSGFKDGDGLFALSGGGENWTWIRVGEVDGKKTTNTSKINQVPFGSPVFIENH